MTLIKSMSKTMHCIFCFAMTCLNHKNKLPFLTTKCILRPTYELGDILVGLITQLITSDDF